MKDAEAVRAACQRLGLPPPIQGTHRLFTSSATGLAVQLPKWRYPAVCREASKFIEQALGQRTGERLTAEFHHVSEAQQLQQRT